MLLEFLESVGNAVNNGIQSMGGGSYSAPIDSMSNVQDALRGIEENTSRIANSMRWRDAPRGPSMEERAAAHFHQQARQGRY